MANAGERLSFDGTTLEVVVTKPGDGDITWATGDGAKLQIGKRYQCEASGAEVLVTKPGDGALECAGNAMVMQEPKKTKSAD